MATAEQIIGHLRCLSRYRKRPELDHENKPYYESEDGQYVAGATDGAIELARELVAALDNESPLPDLPPAEFNPGTDIWGACSRYLQEKFGIQVSVIELQSIADAEEDARGHAGLPWPFVQGSCYYYEDGSWSDGQDGDDHYYGACSYEEMRAFVATSRAACNTMGDSRMVFNDFLRPVLHGTHSYAY